jgi:hypothetical protein
MFQNLIYFFSLLYSQGYGYFAKSRVLRICKWALNMIKWKLINDLYNLQSSTIISLASVAFMVDSENVSTQLWHVAETWKREMIELSKRDLCGQEKSNLDLYEHFVYDKQCKVKFSTIIHRTKSIVDYVHYNL